MGIFKRLFSRRDKNCSQDSNNDLKAYILTTIDKNDIANVICNFEDGCEDEMVDLLLLLYTGGLSEGCMEALVNACDNQAQSIRIFDKVTEGLQRTQQCQTCDGPVVDPCDVFKQGEKNEFKG